IEVVNVKLGTNADSLTIGGESTFLNTVDPNNLPSYPTLPPVRQEHVVRFVHTPTAMVSVSGGAGNDSFHVISTNEVSASGLDTRLGHLVDVTQSQQGVKNTTPEHQHLT